MMWWALLILAVVAVFCVYAIVDLTELIHEQIRESRLASEQPVRPVSVLGGHGRAGVTTPDPMRPFPAGVYDWATEGDAA